MTTETFLIPVQQSIRQVEALMRAQADDNHPDLQAALEHLLSSGGKRVRPIVALLTGEMLGAPVERVITLSAAIEMLHTATLVHDDLIDGALLRRGIATLNAQWSPAATVLTGDFIFARAAKLAAETDSVSVMRFFAQTLATIVNGEINQLFDSRGLASREDYFRRIYAKTASMFELATGAAALLSPVESSVAESAKQVGYQIGMAFQIVDDILDFTGEQATVGKPVASDLRQGLITLPALCYLEEHPDDEDMAEVVAGNWQNQAHMNRLIAAIRESNAIDSAVEEAKQFVSRALDLLAAFPDGEQRDALTTLSEYIVDRTY